LFTGSGADGCGAFFFTISYFFHENFLPALAGVLAIALTQSFSTQAQAPCDLKGIFTDPAQPVVNPEYPTRTNTFN